MRVEIAYDGPGISQENLSHIFDRFFTTKDAGKGSGLGLAICSAIVAEREGRISVERELEQVTALFIDLPITQEEENEIAEEELEEAASPSWKTILVVDDEEVVRDIFIRTLEEGNHRVETAVSGREVG